MKRKTRLFLAGLLSSAIFAWHDYNQKYISCSCKYSCGYNSVQRAFSYFGENVDINEIVKENVENSRMGNFCREVLGGVYKKFNRIVFPAEIEKMCLRHGYSVKRYNVDVAERIRKMEEDGRAGIVWLVYPSLVRHHWEAIPLPDEGNKKVFLQDKFPRHYFYEVFEINKDLARR